MDDSGLGKFLFIAQPCAVVAHCEYLSSVALLNWEHRTCIIGQVYHGRWFNNPWPKMSMETIPKDLRGLRACLVCSLIKVWNTNSS